MMADKKDDDDDDDDGEEITIPPPKLSAMESSTCDDEIVLDIVHSDDDGDDKISNERPSGRLLSGMESLTPIDSDGEVFIGIVHSSDDDDDDDDDDDSKTPPPGLDDATSTTTISQTSKEIRQAARRSRARSISRQASGLHRSRSRTGSSRRSRTNSRRRMTLTEKNEWSNAHTLLNAISVHHLNLPLVMKLKRWAKRAVKRIRKKKMKMKQVQSSQSILAGEDGRMLRHLADFFLICGIDETSSEMKPSILQQYPQNDSDMSIPPAAEAWALPDDIHLIADVSSKESIESRFHHIPLTNEKGGRSHLASLRMYDLSLSIYLSLPPFIYTYIHTYIFNNNNIGSYR
jgi:hypothetical protein